MPPTGGGGKRGKICCFAACARAARASNLSTPKMNAAPSSSIPKHRALSASAFALLVLVQGGLLGAHSADAHQQQQEHGAQAPVVVQPGAPGQPTKTLPSTTHATLPSASKADVEFMQGMIMHHAQAVEMTALIPSHTGNPELRTLGERISRSQSDEIRFMKRWLAARDEPTSMDMAGMPGMDKSG